MRRVAPTMHRVAPTMRRVAPIMCRVAPAMRSVLTQCTRWHGYTYCTAIRAPSPCALYSGAYMHSTVVAPAEKSPVWVAKTSYSP